MFYFQHSDFDATFGIRKRLMGYSPHGQPNVIIRTCARLLYA